MDVSLHIKSLGESLNETIFTVFMFKFTFTCIKGTINLIIVIKDTISRYYRVYSLFLNVREETQLYFDKKEINCEFYKQ